MTTVTFDTYKAVKLLQSKGFKKEQAEGLIEVTKEIDISGAASKEDINLVRKDILEFKSEIYKFILLNNIAVVGVLMAILKYF